VNKNLFRKLILTFQHYQTLLQSIFLSGYRGSKCQVEKNGLWPMSLWKTYCNFYVITKN